MHQKIKKEQYINFIDTIDVDLWWNLAAFYCFLRSAAKRKESKLTYGARKVSGG